MPLTNIIAKIPITVGFGYMIQSNIYLSENYNETSDKLSFKTLEFHLRSEDGRYVPLGNTNISFTILFALK